MNGSIAGKSGRHFISVPTESNRQSRRSVHVKRRAGFPLRAGIQFNFAQPLHKIRQRHSSLQPAQSVSQTEMNPVTKCDVRIWSAAHVKMLRLSKLPRVSVCGPNQRNDQRRFRDDFPMHLDVTGSGAEEPLNRRTKTQHLFDGCPQKLRLSLQARALLRGNSLRQSTALEIRFEEVSCPATRSSSTKPRISLSVSF